MSYTLTIHDLFAMSGGALCGADADVAILDAGIEIDRVRFSGMCRSPEGYRRHYSGKHGLTAKLVAGPGRISFEAVKAEAI
jgi:hypothetical protein